MKFWGLFGMVAPVMPTTHQNFMIGPFTKLDTLHILQYLKQCPLSPDDISTRCTSYTYIFIEHLTSFA